MTKQKQKTLNELTDLEVVDVEHGLSVGLNDQEFAQITRLLERRPNKLELGIFSAMWSEHCSYKSSKAFLARLPKEGKKVLIGPGENAGVIDVGDNLAVAFKVESHNHPSFIEPFQGAATGVGGILRDVFTMGARPFATMNLLRFGAASHKKTPHLLSGVVSGISNYGNCFGVANVISDVAFDASYNGNILVNAFAVGVLPRDKIFLGTASGVGNAVFYVGAKTGRDGIHGATMASDEFSEDKESSRPTVQVGDPFKEKLLLEACLECFKSDIVVGIQDMGAAGLTSSSFEMSDRGECGLSLHLDKVPLRESSMMPYEIMLSESQERMLVVVKQGKEQELVDIFSKWNLDAVDIGKVTEDGLVRLIWHGEEYAALSSSMLTNEAPIYKRESKKPVWETELKKPLSLGQASIADLLSKLVKHADLADQSWVMEQYDYHIGLGTLFHGRQADAALVQIPESKKAVSLTIGCDSRLCAINPYEGSRRNLADQVLAHSCVGAEALGISDCLNFGSPEDPEGMWQLTSSIDGLADAARLFEIPVVSGNVSLYNQTDNKPINPTPTIALVGLQDEPQKAVSNSFQAPGDLIVYIGNFATEVTGAELLFEGECAYGDLPAWDLSKIKDLSSSLSEKIKSQVVLSAARVAKGGLLMTILKSAIASNLGACLNMATMEEQLLKTALFSENSYGIVISIKEEALKDIEKTFSHLLPVNVLGKVQDANFTLACENTELFNMPIEKIKNKDLSAFIEVVHGENIAR